ncbi:MAG TPA: hypothetical protein VII69_11700 [Candidatus Eremiobacteraceae bacterium]
MSEVYQLGEFRLCTDCLLAGRLRELLKIDMPAVEQTVNGTGRSGPIVNLSNPSRR